MDSLTQLTLGAAVGDALLGKKAGRKAAVWGAALGTFPDLDVFIPMGGAIEEFVYHRSFSHSIFVLAALTPIWVWLILKIHSGERKQKRQWAIMVYLVFLTHVLIDSVTVYGTQIFWPLTNYPVSIGSFFIVDPLYTVPLLIGCLIYFVFRKGRFGYKANLTGLAISTIYLVVALGIQSYVKGHAKASLAKQELPHGQVLVTPTPMNTLLWRIVTMDQGAYHVGYYSIFDPEGPIAFRKISNDNFKVPEIGEHKAVQLLRWFTHGFYSLDYVKESQRWVMSDLRMGVEPNYVFSFAIGTSPTKGAAWQPIESVLLPNQVPIERLRLVWDRIFDSNVKFDFSNSKAATQ